MKEVKVYLHSRCNSETGKGGYGYVIVSEEKESNLKASYIKTTAPRMIMRAAIHAMKEVYETFGKCKIILYSNQAELINTMHFGHCKKFAKRPNKDLVYESRLASEFLSVYVRSIKNYANREMTTAQDLSFQALNEYSEKIDTRNADGPKPIPLF